MGLLASYCQAKYVFSFKIPTNDEVRVEIVVSSSHTGWNTAFYAAWQLWMKTHSWVESQ